MIEPATLERGMAVVPLARSESCPGLPPARVLQMALEASTRSWVLILRGAPVMVYGILTRSFMSAEAHLWAIVSDEVENCKLEFAKASKKIVEGLMQKYSVLEVVTVPEYEVANRWVRWLGFSEVEPRPDAPQYRRYVRES